MAGVAQADNGSTKTIVARRSYISDSIGELRKVTFPSRAETIQATVVTIVIVIFASLVLFVLDQVFFHLMAALMQTQS